MINNNKLKTAMITGASRGIGLELTKRLTGEGWHIIALIRSSFPEEEKELQKKIAEGQIRIYKADLSDFVELKSAIEDIKKNEKVIDVLFNNAGGSFDKLYYSAQSREMHFEIHAVVPYIILSELKPLIENGSNKMVVNTSTNAFNFTKKLTYEELIHPKKFKKLIGPYATSKLALSLWSQEISSELSKDGINIMSVHPGGNNTIRKDRKSGLPIFLRTITKWFFAHPSKGAEVLYEAGMGRLSLQTGAFIINRKSKPLKYKEYSSLILEEIQTIYQNEYLTQLNDKNES